MIGLSHVVDDHFITLGRSAACPVSPELRISEEQKLKVFTPNAFISIHFYEGPENSAMLLREN